MFNFKKPLRTYGLFTALILMACLPFLSISAADNGVTYQETNTFQQILKAEPLPDAQACPSGAYVYPAIVKQIYDGDTLTADIDLGFNLWLNDRKVRLLRIDTPELKGATRREGIRSRDWLREKILGKTILLASRGESAYDNFGRVLAEVYELPCHNINDQLVNAGLARYRDY